MPSLGQDPEREQQRGGLGLGQGGAFSGGMSRRRGLLAAGLCAGALAAERQAAPWAPSQWGAAVLLVPQAHEAGRILKKKTPTGYFSQ